MEKTLEQKIQHLRDKEAAKEARRQEMRQMRLAGMTLQTIGDQYGMTRERVRQLLGGSSKRGAAITIEEAQQMINKGGK